MAIDMNVSESPRMNPLRQTLVPRTFSQIYPSSREGVYKPSTEGASALVKRAPFAPSPVDERLPSRMRFIHPELGRIGELDHNTVERLKTGAAVSGPSYTRWQTRVEDYAQRLYPPEVFGKLVASWLQKGENVLDIGIGGGQQWPIFFRNHGLDQSSINFFGTALTQTYDPALRNVLLCDASNLQNAFKPSSLQKVLTDYGIYTPHRSINLELLKCEASDDSMLLNAFKSIAYVLESGGEAVLTLPGQMPDSVHGVIYGPERAFDIVDNKINSETGLTRPNWWAVHLRKL